MAWNPQLRRKLMRINPPGLACGGRKQLRLVHLRSSFSPLGPAQALLVEEHLPYADKNGCLRRLNLCGLKRPHRQLAPAQPAKGAQGE
jgi:hypothetical protein